MDVQHNTEELKLIMEDSIVYSPIPSSPLAIIQAYRLYTYDYDPRTYWTQQPIW